MNQSFLSNDPVLANIVDRLVHAYQPIEIYLFGSVAREESGPDSDYDLLIVVSDDTSQKQKKSHLAYKVLRGTGVASDIVIWTESEFKKRLHLKASLPSIVKDEGQLLYAA